jgi:hypothetical protein
MTTDDEREALAPIRALVADLAGRLNHVETHWTPDERSAPMFTAEVLREFDRLAAGFRRQGPITDAQVEAARFAYAGERVNQSLRVGTEPNTVAGRAEKSRAAMRAALEAARVTP